MQIACSFDKERRLILTKVAGRLNIAITEDYFLRLHGDKNCPEDAIEMVAFSGLSKFTISIT